MTYAIALERGADGTWWVEVLDLPGCFSCGETREEAAENAHEAIESHLAALRDAGEPLPSGAGGAIGVRIVDPPADGG
jgi:predicted RNase H-like HicB family nuclease